MYGRNKNVGMIPDLLAKLIDEKQMSLAQLEKVSGISQHTFKRCVNRENGLQYGTAIKLNQFFETTLFSPYQIKPNGELTYIEQSWRINKAANKFSVGTVVKNLFNKKLETITKVRFNKQIQEWEYLLAGENQYIEEQFIKSLDKQPMFMPPHKIKPKEEPKVEKVEIKLEPDKETKERIANDPIRSVIKECEEPKTELIKKIKEIENTMPANIAPKDNKEELKHIILTVVERLLCLL